MEHRLAPEPVDALSAPSDDMATFFDVSLDLLCIRDAAFRFEKVNAAWEATLGYRADELEGRAMLDFIHPEDALPSREEMERLRVDQEVRGFLNRYRCKDGSYRHLEWRARRVGDRVFGVARDVTERMAVQAEMAAARVAAEAANQAKSEFLANMSHEIRTPLNGVIGVAAALARTELSPPQREMVGLISSSGATLERIVSDVLDFSKIEAGRLEIERRPFDLAREVDAVIEMFRLRAHEKGLGFAVEQGSGVRGEFVGDAVRIRQVLANLLSNAVKFTTAGQVRVAVRIDENAAQPAILSIVVQDTGVGFGGDFAQDIFQRFRQADSSITRRFGGSGLGLSITRGLVDLMDGDIEVQSQPGEGSRFEVSLPLERAVPLAAYDAAHARPANDGARDGAAGRLAGLKILLAEDHPINRRVVELILAPFGVELTTVEDGGQALAAVEGGAFDLILMDMQMPVMDGLAATREIRRRERSGRTPLVMLSANAMRQHEIESLAAGADLHLAKPVTAEALVAGVLAALDQAGAAR